MSGLRFKDSKTMYMRFSDSDFRIPYMYLGDLEYEPLSRMLSFFFKGDIILGLLDNSIDYPILFLASNLLEASFSGASQQSTEGSKNIMFLGH